MTDDEIIRAWAAITRLVPERANIIAFARAVAAHEREECGRVCEGEYLSNPDPRNSDDLAYNVAIAHCAAAIRSRT